MYSLKYYRYCVALELSESKIVQQFTLNLYITSFSEECAEAVKHSQCVFSDYINFDYLLDQISVLCISFCTKSIILNACICNVTQFLTFFQFHKNVRKFSPTIYGLHEFSEMFRTLRGRVSGKLRTIGVANRERKAESETKRDLELNKTLLNKYFDGCCFVLFITVLSQHLLFADDYIQSSQPSVVLTLLPAHIPYHQYLRATTTLSNH